MFKHFRFVAVAIALSSMAPISSLQSATAADDIELVSCSNAASDGGTCCQEFGSQCYPNNCSTQDCAVQGTYWRTDGKPCGAAQ